MSTSRSDVEQGAATAAPQHAEMPYRRAPGRCEICGLPSDQLWRVVVTAPRKRPHWAARVAYVCRRHVVGEPQPVKTPRATTKVGTSKRQPQQERLFPLPEQRP